MKILFILLTSLIFCSETFGQTAAHDTITTSKEKHPKNFILHRNPPKNLITLEPRTAFTGYAEICSMEGVLIKKTRLKSKEILDIDIKNLSAGQYLIKISDQDFQPSEIFNFVKQ